MRSTPGLWLFACVLAMALVIGGPVAGAQQPQKPADEEFVPIDQLPPDEKLPAAPFVIAAYSVAWLVVAGYLWSIKQRLGRVEREIEDVSRRVMSSAGTASARESHGAAPERGREGGGR